ncbi:MAG: tRNA 2-selenouridine(34) synthase MnmH [Pseudobdellovibrio sp.]
MNNDELRNLFLQKTPLIDVRAPVEFAQGHLPGAVNLPILNDEERALIGTTYKQEGNEAAVKLGYELVSGEIKKNRVQKWVDYIRENPETVIYCFRGGLRSQITQKWILETGINRPLIKGGYKRTRQFLIDEIQNYAQNSEMILISGPTGSGKTDFLQQMQTSYPAIDLEALACHRGSAFGATDREQPSQINFENALALELMKSKVRDLPKALLLEDESHLIGKRAIPKTFFDQMRASPVVWIEEPLETRVQNIFRDYVVARMKNQKRSEIFGTYKSAILKISKKLGGLRTQELLKLLEDSENEYLNSQKLDLNKTWIEKLLIYYYDPMYLGSIERRRVSVLFKGRSSDCAEYLLRR